MKNTLSAILLMVIFLHVQADELKSDEVINKIEDFSTVLEKTINAMQPVISPPSALIREWYRRKHFGSDFSYDVRKTDSLVSPFIGEIKYLCKTSGVSAMTEEDAKTAPNKYTSKGESCRISLAYQKKKWSLKSVECLGRLNTVGELVWQTATSPTQGSVYYCSQASLNAWIVFENATK